MKRILLAEDDPAVSYILTRYLDKAGFAVRAAPDGRAALALFDAEPADLLVTDFRMPGMNGEELILALRAAAGLAGLDRVGLRQRTERADSWRAGIEQAGGGR